MEPITTKPLGWGGMRSATLSSVTESKLERAGLSVQGGPQDAEEQASSRQTVPGEQKRSLFNLHALPEIASRVRSVTLPEPQPLKRQLSGSRGQKHAGLMIEGSPSTKLYG